MAIGLSNGTPSSTRWSARATLLPLAVGDTSARTIGLEHPMSSLIILDSCYRAGTIQICRPFGFSQKQRLLSYEKLGVVPKPPSSEVSKFPGLRSTLQRQRT